MTYTEQQIAKALDGHFYHMDHTRAEPAVIDLRTYTRNPPRIKLRPQKAPVPKWTFTAPVGRKPTVAEILIVVEHFYKVHVQHLTSDIHNHRAARAKHGAYWLARNLAGLSYPKIGRFMGGRDHTTVLHGVQAVDRNRARHEPELSRCIAALEGRE